MDTKIRDAQRPANTARALWAIVPLMSLLVSLAACGAYVTDAFVTNRAFRFAGFAAATLLGATGIAVIVLNTMEALQLRRWRTWHCPKCGADYNVRDYSDVVVWLRRDGPSGPGRGVVLRCGDCVANTSFDDKGNVVGENASNERADAE